MQNPNAIECISVYTVEIPFQALGSRWRGRDKPECLDSTVVVVETRAGRVGGLTPALGMRDLCTLLGIPMYVQCAGGIGITQAAIVHLAHSVAPERLFYLWDIGDLVTTPTVRNPVPSRHGWMHAHELPGLGAEPLPEILGEAVAVYA